MIKIENVEVIGFEHAIRGMRNPMNSWDNSDSEFGVMYDDAPGLIEVENDDIWFSYIGPKDKDLMMVLRRSGTDHRKFMRMIAVYLDITAPLYWWKEFDTYKVGTVANSCSTMHKIHAKEFTLEDFSHEHMNVKSLDILKKTIDRLNESRRVYLNGGWSYDKNEKWVKLEPKDKYIWWQLIQLLPSSYNQKRTVMLNYEVLANMFAARCNHKLDEWKKLCEWMRALPYSELITDEPKKLNRVIEYVD